MKYIEDELLTMDDNLKSLLNVDKNTELMIFGFIHRAETEMNHIIPPLISWTCLIFYWINEYFDIIRNATNVTVDKLSLAARSNTKNWNNSSFGASKIKSTNTGIYKWSLSKSGNERILIGITDADGT